MSATNREIALNHARAFSSPQREIIEAAVELVGTGYPDSAYAEALFPHDVPWNQNDFAKQMSSCGIFVEACWRRAGVDAPFLDKPYAERIGTAITAGIAWAKKAGCWVDATRWKPGKYVGPSPGDAVVMGINGNAQWSVGEVAITHMSLVVGSKLSIDGGQPGPNGGSNAIRWRERTYVEVPGQLWAMHELGTLTGNERRPVSRGRRVLGFIRF